MPCQRALGQRIRIFFDTEFTGLTADAKLISIGFVDETGAHEFYAELTDTYSLSDCSAFCIRKVIPHLQGGSARRTISEVRRELTFGCINGEKVPCWSVTKRETSSSSSSFFRMVCRRTCPSRHWGSSRTGDGAL